MRLSYLWLFGLFFVPFFAVAEVEITEVAWMGTDVSSTDEWIELYNNGTGDVDLTNWVLTIQDKKDILLEGVISANYYYLIERTDEDSVPGITADLIYSFGTGLTNTGAVLILKNSGGSEVDKIDASGGWPAGDNSTKETMQKSGSSWITAIDTPRAQNVEQEQGGEEPEVSGGSSGGQPDSGQENYIPPENLPQIKAYAGKDKTMVAGALDEFRGEAYGFENDPLENARFLWNFGDGTTQEGKNISHFYEFPGNYVVALYVSSGKNAASDRMTVKVIASKIIISEIKTGGDSFIEFQNGSKETINMSGWSFRSGSSKFIFPKDSFIGPDFFLVVPNSVSGVLFSEGSGRVELLYPNGFIADYVNYAGKLSTNESFARYVENNNSYIARETPGETNEILAKSVAVPDNPVAPAQAVYKQVSEVIATDEQEIAEEAGSTTSEKEIYQEANVVSAIQGNTFGKWFYFGLVLALVLISGLGVFVIRHKGGLNHFF